MLAKTSFHDTLLNNIPTTNIERGPIMAPILDMALLIGTGSLIFNKNRLIPKIIARMFILPIIFLKTKLFSFFISERQCVHTKAICTII